MTEERRPPAGPRPPRPAGGRHSSALRITAGTLRGRRVTIPKGDLRPTSERARQAYFNIVTDRIAGARFLDLFAGSGIFSFEAVSRGAASATAVDASRASIASIATTARQFAIDVKTIQADVLTGIKRLDGNVFDLVYADPPYDWEQYDDLLMAVDQHNGLAPEALVAFEHRRRTNPFTHNPERLRFLRRTEYGEVWIDFFIA